MKILKSEKGNTLVITILVLVMAAVIGLSLMSLSMNGTKRNVHREDDTQATRYAENGIKHMTLHLEKKVHEILFPKNENPEKYYPNIGGQYDHAMKAEFLSSFNGEVDDYLCDSGTTKLIDSNKYEVCIEDASSHNSSNDTLKELIFISKGFADGEEKKITSTIKIGAKYSEEPDILNYAVATHTEGNLFLNGGADIRGNVLADGNIVITDSSYVSSNTNPWVKNVFPSVHDNDEFLVNPNNKLFVNNNTMPTKLRYADLAVFNFNNKANTPFTTHNVSEVNNFIFGNPTVYNTSKLNSVNVFDFVVEGETKLNPSSLKYNTTYKKDYLLWDKPAPLYESNKAKKPTFLKYGIQSSKKNPVVTGRYKTNTHSILHDSNYQLGQGNNDSFFFEEANLSLLKGNNQLNGDFYFDNHGMKINLKKLVEYLTEPIGELKLLKKVPLIGPIVHGLLDTVLNAVSDIVGVVDDIANKVINIDIEDTSLFIYDGNQTLNGNFYINGIETPPNSLIQIKLGNSGDALSINKGNHTIKGTYYINGDVMIKNAEILADAVFYVNGNVSFINSSIEGVDGGNGKLIVFAQGDINYNPGPKTQGTEIDAYFYAKRNIEIHGATSEITINGGVAGNQVFLSGFKGEKPKLTINNNKDLLKTYSVYGRDIYYQEIVQQPSRLISRKVE